MRSPPIPGRTIATHNFLALAGDGEGACVAGEEEDEQDEEDEAGDGAEDYACDCGGGGTIDLVGRGDDGRVLAWEKGGYAF